MTRKRKKYQAPQRCDPERSQQTASRAADRVASGPTTHVGRLCGLLAVCGFLLLATIIVFGQTAGHDFVNFDDGEYVYENWHVRAGLTGAGTAWAVTALRSEER